MGFILEDSLGNQASITSGSLHVQLPVDITKAGYVVAVGETDDGTVTGTPDRKAFEVSDDYRLRVGLDTPLFSEYFNGSALNSSLYTAPVTTMTIVQTNGVVTLNNGSSLASAAVAQLQTRRFFPMYITYGISYEFDLAVTSTPVTNNVVEWGAFIGSGTTAPTDGVLFRLNASGELRAVVIYNSSETSTVLDFNTATGGINTFRHYAIVVVDATAYFFVNDILQAKIERPAAQGSMTVSPQLPMSVRTYNSSATSTAQQVKVATMSAHLLDAEMAKPWAMTLAGMGGAGSQGQTGQTQGSTANYANSSTPTANVPANAYSTGTFPASQVGLGGQFFETASLAANTDGIICAYRVPAGSATSPGKSLYIHGIWISSYVQTVLTGGGNNEQWVLAVGSVNNSALNDPSLATTDDLISKAPRRVPLGSRPVAANAAAITQLNDIYRSFVAPVLVQPGEFVIVAKKVVGTASSAGVFAHVIGFDAVFE